MYFVSTTFNPSMWSDSVFHLFYFQVQFEDPNVIELIGVVTRTDKFMIVTEYMKNGSLKEYLKVRYHTWVNWHHFVKRNDRITENIEGLKTVLVQSQDWRTFTKIRVKNTDLKVC